MKGQQKEKMQQHMADKRKDTDILMSSGNCYLIGSIT